MRTHRSLLKLNAKLRSPWNGRFTAICSQLFPFGEQEQLSASELEK
jgi:hypothetical protein